MFTKFLVSGSIVGLMVGGCLVNRSGGDNGGGAGGTVTSTPSSVAAGGMATTLTSTATTTSTTTSTAVGGGTGSAGTGGAGTGGAPPCASVEWCNGVDDNCMGGIDEECPTGIDADSFNQAPVRGAAPPQQGFDEDFFFCDEGDAIVKVELEVDSGYVVRGKAWCSSLGFVPSTSGPHSEWELAAAPLGGANEDFEFGNGNGTPVVTECENGTFAYGVEGHWTDNQGSANGLHAFGLHCARLRLVGDTTDLSWERVAAQTTVIAGNPGLGNMSDNDDFPVDRVLMAIGFRESDVNGGLDRFSHYVSGSERLNLSF